MRRFVAERYVAITVVSLLVTALSAWVLVSQWSINSDFRALLPDDAPATQALEKVESRLGSSTAMFVVVDSPSLEANKRFARDFAERLRAMDEIALAHFHNQKSFFEKHELLYLRAEDLRTLRERIDEAIREGKKRANPLFVPLDDSPEPDIETKDLEEKYRDEIDQYKEYLVSDDLRSLTIVVRFTEAATSFEATQRLLDRIENLAKEVGPAEYHPQMNVEYGGGLVARQSQYETVMSDVGVSAFGELAVLMLVIALFFRRFRAVLLVFVPLIMGVLWTLALAFAVMGELTTLSVFIFAILLGLGIDFTLHILNSYDKHREGGLEPIDALVACYLSTGRATIVGGVTTFATFMVLAFAKFRGIAQFGQISAAGILLTLLSMLVTLPALILTLQRIWPRDPSRIDVVQLVVPQSWPTPSPRVAWSLLGGVALLMIFWSAVQIPKVRFEEDYSKIGEIQWPWEGEESEMERRDKPGDSSRLEAQRLAKRVREKAVRIRQQVAPESFVPDKRQVTTQQKYSSALQGQISSIPIILLFDEADEAKRAYRRIANMHEAGKLDAFASVSSIYSFLPATVDAQERRLDEIEKIRALIEREDLSKIKKKLRNRVDELRDKLDVGVVTIRDLPEWTKRFFREVGSQAKPPAESEQYAYEYVIFMVGKVDQLNGPEARQLVGQLDLIRAQVEGDFIAASEAEAYVALLDEIQQKGVRLIFIAFGVVLLILIVAFKHPVRGFISMSSLVFSGLILFGILGALQIHLDVYNVVFLSAIVGISVDDDVHLYRRYLDMGHGHIVDAIKWVGPAVAMNTITSGIGFGGLAITENAGLQSIGHLAVVGVICSLLSTMIMLPLVLKLAELSNLEAVAAPPRDE